MRTASHGLGLRVSFVVVISQAAEYLQVFKVYPFSGNYLLLHSIGYKIKIKQNKNKTPLKTHLLQARHKSDVCIY